MFFFENHSDDPSYMPNFQSVTVCLGSRTIFLYSHFYVLIGMSLKAVVRSCLLSKDELLTPHIDGVMAFCIFKMRAQNTKNSRTLDLLILVFILFCPRPLEESPF